MNLFDKEDRIIEYFQFLEKKDVLLIPHSLKNINIYNQINSKKKWNKWTNSSSKKDLPPDFYNENKKLMMDIMRVDDHAFCNEKGKIINPTNERESKLIEELINKNKMFKEIAEKGNLIVIPDSGLRGKKDHNYNFYINNFKRVIKKHISKIDNYKKNHPGYIIIFFIFDESSPYIECIGNERPKFVGQGMHAKPHLWWNDYNFIEILLKSQIDYVVWMTPFKHFDSKEKIELPQATIIDVSKIRGKHLNHYNQSKMESLEI